MKLDFCHSCIKGSQAEEGERGEMKRHIATSVKCRSVSEGAITHLPIEEKEVTWTEYLQLLLLKKSVCVHHHVRGILQHEAPCKDPEVCEECDELPQHDAVTGWAGGGPHWAGCAGVFPGGGW